MKDIHAKATGVLFTRMLLGIIFMMQGFGKVFNFTVPKVYDMFFKDFEKTFLPVPLLWATVYYTSYIEMIGGFYWSPAFFANMPCSCWLLTC